MRHGRTRAHNIVRVVVDNDGPGNSREDGKLHLRLIIAHAIYSRAGRNRAMRKKAGKRRTVKGFSAKRMCSKRKTRNVAEISIVYLNASCIRNVSKVDCENFARDSAQVITPLFVNDVPCNGN